VITRDDVSKQKCDVGRFGVICGDDGEGSDDDDDDEG
jgi:hypothetical protein